MVAGSAAADPSVASGGPILVFESHVGDRPDDFARLAPALDDELEAHGFAARPATILKLAAGRVPLPGILDAGTSASSVAAETDAGYDAFLNGKYGDAVATLTDVVHKIERNPAALALDTSNADVTFKAIATLALTQRKQGDASGSVDTMTELIRMFPARPLTRSEYGPDSERFYRDVLRQTQETARGRLSISAGDPSAVIFVDGQIRGVGKASLDGLLPGVYRVLVQVPSTMGRQYRIDVEPNREATLDANPAIDDALSATSAWVGFSFATEADRAKEAEYAGALARRWIGGEQVALVGTTERAGKPELFAALYRTDGQLVRSAVANLDGADESRVRALARFLADGTGSDDIDIEHGGERGTVRAPAAEAPPSGAHHSRSAILVLGAGGLVAVASGIVYAASPADDHTQPTYNDVRTPMVESFAAGAVVVGAGTYLWLRHSHGASPASAALVGAGVASILSGAMLYATNEDLYHGPGRQRETYRPTATDGIVVGAAGAALTGLGVLLLLHHAAAEDGSAPVVSFGAGGGSIAWGGAF